ncbi:MAG: phosphotransferase [Chloroflexota bacterium]|nr:phosphotransferase [Chloroflexota bacterium]
MADGARVDTLLVRIAGRLGVEVVAPLAGGEFGALHVRDDNDRNLVLKAMPSTALAERYARGAKMAERLRSLGYPAPYYAGTGVELGASWSLQERLPGAVPQLLTEAHALRLIELAKMHAGAAGAGSPGREDKWPSSTRARLAQLEARDETRTLGAELRAVFRDLAHVELLHDGIVHGDFHHRNFLADGDRITGVFDWDFANTGDWRFDLVTLAFWSAMPAGLIPPAVSNIIISRTRELCPPDVLALLAARRALLQLEFDERVHPERLAGLISGIEANVAPWWRA